MIIHSDRVAQVLCEHWTDIFNPHFTASKQQCDAYLKILHIPASVIKPAPLLFRQNSEQLVIEAFDRQVT